MKLGERRKDRKLGIISYELSVRTLGSSDLTAEDFVRHCGIPDPVEMPNLRFPGTLFELRDSKIIPAVNSALRRQLAALRAQDGPVGELEARGDAESTASDSPVCGTLAAGIPWGEVILGAVLMSGLAGRPMLWLTALLFSCFTLVHVAVAVLAATWTSAMPARATRASRSVSASLLLIASLGLFSSSAEGQDEAILERALARSGDRHDTGAAATFVAAALELLHATSTKDGGWVHNRDWEFAKWLTPPPRALESGSPVRTLRSNCIRAIAGPLGAYQTCFFERDGRLTPFFNAWSADLTMRRFFSQSCAARMHRLEWSEAAMDLRVLIALTQLSGNRYAFRSGNEPGVSEPFHQNIECIRELLDCAADLGAVNLEGARPLSESLRPIDDSNPLEVIDQIRSALAWELQILDKLGAPTATDARRHFMFPSVPAPADSASSTEAISEQARAQRKAYAQAANEVLAAFEKRLLPVGEEEKIDEDAWVQVAEAAQKREGLNSYFSSQLSHLTRMLHDAAWLSKAKRAWLGTPPSVARDGSLQLARGLQRWRSESLGETASLYPFQGVPASRTTMNPSAEVITEISGALTAPTCDLRRLQLRNHGELSGLVPRIQGVEAIAADLGVALVEAAIAEASRDNASEGGSLGRAVLAARLAVRLREAGTVAASLASLRIIDALVRSGAKLGSPQLRAVRGELDALPSLDPTSLAASLRTAPTQTAGVSRCNEANEQLAAWFAPGPDSTSDKDETLRIQQRYQIERSLEALPGQGPWCLAIDWANPTWVLSQIDAQALAWAPPFWMDKSQPARTAEELASELAVADERRKAVSRSILERCKDRDTLLRGLAPATATDVGGR